jgi:hypothetical protein
MLMMRRGKKRRCLGRRDDSSYREEEVVMDSERSWPVSQPTCHQQHQRQRQQGARESVHRPATNSPVSGVSLDCPATLG